MPDRAVFLDRDNTIIENSGYLGVAAQVKLLPGAATALSAIRALGYRLIVVSNQSGVARGMFAETDVEAVNQEMCRQLRDLAAAHIDASYYCPYHPDAVIPEYKIDHDWRKPKPGMLRQAAADFNLDLSQCWMIGDQPRDVAAGSAAGCRTILLRDPDRTSADPDPATLQVSPNFIVKTLADAARIVAHEGKNPQPTSPSSGITTPAATPLATPAAPSAPPSPRPASESLPPETLTQRLARQTSAPPHTSSPSSSNLEKAIDELVALLRHQQRKADAPPDFSRTKGAALLVQIFAILALIVGFYRLATAGSSFQAWDKTYLVVTNLESAAIYILAAGVLQLGVIALLLLSKDR